MNILAIGDVVGSIGCNFLRSQLPRLKKEKEIDVVIANGENSADGNGITPASMNHLFTSGVDVITTGNHAFRRREAYQSFDENCNVIRPANYPNGTTPGNGFCVLDMGKVQICVINMLGTVYMESLNCPFKTIDEILKDNRHCSIKILDFHAEATAEKRAMAFYLDGRVSAVFGTHTHVQTSDETILKGGTGYITDVGMTGVVDSVLGVKSEISIQKMKYKLPIRFELADGKCCMDCILFKIDDTTGKTTYIERLKIV